MVFSNPPVDVAASLGTSFQIDNSMRTPVIFKNGANLFIGAFYADASSKCGIAKSADGGVSWASQDQSYPGLISPDDVLFSSHGAIVFLGQVFGFGDRSLSVLTFDMSTGLYVSTAPTLTGASSYNNGHGLAVANGDYYFFSEQAGHPTMNRLSAGAWSANVVLDAVNIGALAFGDACSVEDSNGDVHLYYSQGSPSSSLVYVKVSGLSHTAPVTLYSTQQHVYDAICFGGKQYIALGKTPAPVKMYAIEGNSDTAPSAWTDVPVDTANVGVGGVNVQDASLFLDGSNLSLFYSAIDNVNHVQQIWQSKFISGVWGAPVSAFDAASNPPSTQPITSQFLNGIDVILNGAGAYACAMNAHDNFGGSVVYFLNSASSGPTFASRYRGRSN